MCAEINKYIYINTYIIGMRKQINIYIYTHIYGKSNGKLPPRTYPGCSVPESYRSHDWALIPANPASKAEY